MLRVRGKLLNFFHGCSEDAELLFLYFLRDQTEY